MLALLVRSDTCISYAAPNHLLWCFYASPGTFLLRNRVVHLCIIHTSSMHRPCLIYPTSTCHLCVSPMSHPGYHLCMLCPCIHSALPLHLLCIIHVSCMHHLRIMYTAISYVPSMYPLCNSSVSSMLHLCVISASFMYHLCITYASYMHHLYVVYVTDYTIYAPSVYRLCII